jgi:serine/threonine protein kinase
MNLYESALVSYCRKFAEQMDDIMVEGIFERDPYDIAAEALIEEADKLCLCMSVEGLVQALQNSLSKRNTKATPSSNDSAGAPDPFLQKQVGIPADLQTRYRIEEPIEALSVEGDLYLATERATGRRLVAKVYRRGWSPNLTVLARAGSFEHGHLVRQVDFSRRNPSESTRMQEQAWEVMEHVPLGSLDRHIGAAKPFEVIYALIEQIGGALHYLHRLAPPLVHRDVRPANILVRSLEPFDLALADFNQSAIPNELRDTATVIFSKYAAPEASRTGFQPTGDWWSLGVIAAEDRVPGRGVARSVPVSVRG